MRNPQCRQTASSFFPTSLCLLTQRKSALRCCFPSFPLREFAFLILIASGARASSLARQCKKCGGLQRRERPSFVISLRGLAFQKLTIIWTGQGGRDATANANFGLWIAVAAWLPQASPRALRLSLSLGHCMRSGQGRSILLQGG